MPRRTAYVRWGDLPALCPASLGIAFGLARLRREVRGEERGQQQGYEVLTYRGISLVLRRTPREWIVYVGAASGPRIIAGADRAAALSRAEAWVDAHHKYPGASRPSRDSHPARRSHAYVPYSL